MKSLRIFKQLRAFSTRTMYACMIGASILSVNGCKNTNDDQIIPKETSMQSLAKEYNLKVVAKPADSRKIIYLKDIGKAHQFFQNLKLRKKDLPNANESKSGRVSATVLSHGFFTFLNGQTATIHFNMHPDGLGEIVSANLNGEDLSFTKSGNYVEMIKWGVIAVPNNENELIGNYDYYYAPVAIYRAFLVNGGWSSVQLLNQFEQGNFEGEGGNWEMIYIANPYLPGNDLPVIDPWVPAFPQSF